MDFIWDNLFDLNKKEKTIRTFLQKNVLFQDLNSRELTLIEKIIHIRSFRPGETIFRQGDVGLGMYILLKGVVNIYVEELEPQTGEIKSVHITQLKEDDFFGDMALVEENGRRTASASAHEECEVIVFLKPNLMEVTERNPQAGIKILLRLGQILGLRLKETTAKISDLKKKVKPEL